MGFRIHTLVSFYDSPINEEIEFSKTDIVQALFTSVFCVAVHFFYGEWVIFLCRLTHIFNFSSSRIVTYEHLLKERGIVCNRY